MKGTRHFLKTKLTLTVFSLLFSQLTHAIGGGILPGSVEPGQVGNTLSAPPIKAPTKRAAPVPQPPEQAGGLGPQAAQIKFKLVNIILEGNRVYSDKQLRPLYADKLNKVITIAQLEDIVQSITNYYRNNGYILTRAVLPPQHVKDGIVHVRVLEGYIAKVNIQGDPKRAKYLLQEYADNITQSRPTQISVMEHYLRISNEIPGMDAKAVLEPSKTEVAASDMNIVANEKTWGGYLSYDNYGTRYIGPNQVTANITGNSLFQSGDSTQFTGVRTSRPEQLQYEDFSHQFPIGNQGVRLTLGANDSRTLPGLDLAPLKISGDSTNFYTTVTYPWIRSRDQDLTLDAGANYIDSGVNIFDATLYNDHLRTVKAGASYDLTDRFGGSNIAAAHLEQGLPILGASNDPNSLTVSRFGADGIFTKITANAGRLQHLFSRYSAFLYTTGQYSFNPLLATEQFAYGGSQLGRGYDPAEIIGDRGFAGSIELRMDTAPGLFLLQTLQPYVFYDAGVIWNIKNVPGVKQKQSATSTGVGVRFTFTKYLSGNFMFAQPLTKQVQAEEVVGQGRLPRSFFSIVASA